MNNTSKPKFNKGDTVRVASRIDNAANWKNNWCESMNAFIGKNVVIRYNKDWNISGYLVEGCIFGWPEDCFELVEKAPVVISMKKRYETIDGNPVRILCVDSKNEFPVVGLVRLNGHDQVFMASSAGLLAGLSISLQECTDWSQLAIDTQVMVRLNASCIWKRRYFAGLIGGLPYVWDGGATSWSASEDKTMSFWPLIKLADA